MDTLDTWPNCQPFGIFGHAGSTRNFGAAVAASAGGIGSVTLPVAAHSAPRANVVPNPDSRTSSGPCPSVVTNTRPDPVLCRPQHWLVNARTRNRLARLALIERVIVVGSRENVIAAFGLPAKVGVQLVGRDSERFQPACDRMLGVLDVDGEIVSRGMMAVVRPPVAAAHLFVFGPPVERAKREVIEHQTFARADERFERCVCAITPAILVAAVVVVDDDEVVVARASPDPRRGTPR